MDALVRHGADAKNVTVVRVPGAFELPLVAKYADVWHTWGTPNSLRETNARLDALAAELLALPKEERAQLLAKLLGKGEA